MQAALAGGVKVISEVRVQSVDIAKTTIILASGEMISADLIIAADGLHVGHDSLDTNNSLRLMISLPLSLSSDPTFLTTGSTSREIRLVTARFDSCFRSRS